MHIASANKRMRSDDMHGVVRVRGEDTWSGRQADEIMMESDMARTDAAQQQHPLNSTGLN